MDLKTVCNVGNLDVVKTHVEQGQKDKRECTDYCPLKNAVYFQTLNNRLHDACKAGHTDIVKYLLSNGAFDKQKAFNGACLGGHLDIVQLLIAKGIRIIDNRYGKAAFWGSHTKIYNMLMNTLFHPYIYWTIIYNNVQDTCSRARVVQRDLIPELFKLMSTTIKL